MRDAAEQVEAIVGLLSFLLVAGGCDPVSNFTVQSCELAVRLRAAGANVTETYYPGARHEVLNEINRQQMRADILDWIQSR
jgi:alpha-beta hydrolase superfamily lysophospholipase